MCLLHCNSTASKDLDKIKPGYANLEGRLATLADADTIQQENGLGKLWASVDAWSKDEVLCKVRKYRSGRHRFYFVGDHTECNYHLRFVLPFKRDETDQAKQSWFQNKVLKAIADDEVYRTLEIPRAEEGGDDEG